MRYEFEQLQRIFETVHRYEKGRGRDDFFFGPGAHKAFGANVLARHLPGGCSLGPT